ncbi:LuxR C-terminal-related transcriptional regulator [Streptomyces sp. NPDC006624]|uniref:LuxR C-terminal-related transcriptional regulator n=1 Tax=Streptomyces sp. NPDC006624 TaxID=3154892 RepID=UPI00339E34E7
MGGSAPRRDHQVPVETTSFVDRRGELTAGRELLARARLVTLTGPGGVGKTRLAARIAARVRRAFPDGVRFVHLSGLHDPALVPLAAADALGLHDHSAQPPLTALVEQVRDRRLLLVVDNCEHLAGACARLAAALLHGTEGVRILATSRHRLGLTEEHLLEVRPLPVPDPDGDLGAAEGYPALTLFADRAAAVAPDFRLTAANLASVARLCRRLDGLPLAIELAAVRMRVLDVDQLLDRLDDRYRVLTTGSPAALPRHQTLRAAVAWSHDLCTGPEQAVWARLSVLAGSFDLETAEAVCADAADADAAGAEDAARGAEAVSRGLLPEEAAGAAGAAMVGQARSLAEGAAQWAEGALRASASSEGARSAQAHGGTLTLPPPAGGEGDVAPGGVLIPRSASVAGGSPALPRRGAPPPPHGLGTQSPLPFGPGGPALSSPGSGGTARSSPGSGGTAQPSPGSDGPVWLGPGGRGPLPCGVEDSARPSSGPGGPAVSSPWSGGTAQPSSGAGGPARLSPGGGGMSSSGVEDPVHSSSGAGGPARLSAGGGGMSSSGVDDPAQPASGPGGPAHLRPGGRAPLPSGLGGPVQPPPGSGSPASLRPGGPASSPPRPGGPGPHTVVGAGGASVGRSWPALRRDDVLDAVAGLVDKSVLCREPGPGGVRYRMLDTLREYGLEQLRHRAGEEAAARRRQRDWMVRRVEAWERGWFGPGQPETVALLRADRDNLRAALDHSLSTPGEARTGLHLAGTLWFHWHACGALREGLYWLDRALAAHPEPTRERARGLWVAGLLAAATQNLSRGLAHATEALALARALGVAAEAAHAEYVIGVIRLFGDDLPGALRHFEATVARGPVPGQHLSLVGLDQVELACALGFLGEADRAVEVCERALRLCERHGEQWVRSYVLRMLALAHSVRADWPRAERHAREALRLKLAVHDITGIALTLDLLASIAVARGAHEHAAELLGGSDRVWADIDTGRWGSRSLTSARRDSEEQVCRALGREAFERAHRRGGVLGLAELVAHALQEPAGPATPPPHDGTTGPLTRREQEVARLVAEGLGNQQIADRLVIARRTAEGHVERILSKLGFTNRSQIAAWMTAQR